MHLTGSIVAGYTSDKTKNFSPVFKMNNLVLFEAADIITGLLNGDNSLRLSHMYLQYTNTNSYTYSPEAITRSSGRADFDALTGASPDYIDYLRVPIWSQGRFSKSPAETENYESNVLSLVATTASVGAIGEISGLSPAGNYFAASGDQGGSYIFSAALVSAPHPENPSADKVFSRVNFATPLEVLAGSQPTIWWSIRIS